MKKLMFGMAAALALCGMAIESSNIVGYQTKAVEAGKFYILGVQFEGVGVEADVNKIVSGFTGGSLLEDDDFTKTAPQIQIPNARGTYDVYYYLKDGWYDNGTEDGDFKPGWCDLNGVIAGDAESTLTGLLEAGVAMWVKDVQAAESFQTAGQVPSDDRIEVTAPANFSLRANAFPQAFNLNDETQVEYSGLTAGDLLDEDTDFTKVASQIQVPNAKGTYDVYYYLSNGWYNNGTEDGDFKPGWCDLNGVIAGDAESTLTGEVSAGQGFWTKGVAAPFTISFKK